jgi:hypothetical protein
MLSITHLIPSHPANQTLRNIIHPVYLISGFPCPCPSAEKKNARPCPLCPLISRQNVHTLIPTSLAEAAASELLTLKALPGSCGLYKHKKPLARRIGDVYLEPWLPTGFLRTVPLAFVSTRRAWPGLGLLLPMGRGPVILRAGDRMSTALAELTCGSGEI